MSKPFPYTVQDFLDAYQKVGCQPTQLSYARQKDGRWCMCPLATLAVARGAATPEDCRNLAKEGTAEESQVLLGSWLGIDQRDAEAFIGAFDRLYELKPSDIEPGSPAQVALGVLDALTESGCIKPITAIGLNN